MKIDLAPDLAARLMLAARRLKRDPAECAVSAILAFVADCEEASAHAAQFGDGVVRMPDDGFMD
jgi:predicted transcriptional regulator